MKGLYRGVREGDSRSLDCILYAFRIWFYPLLMCMVYVPSGLVAGLVYKVQIDGGLHAFTLEGFDI